MNLKHKNRINDFTHSLHKLVGFVQLEKLTLKSVNFPKSWQPYVKKRRTNDK